MKRSSVVLLMVMLVGLEAAADEYNYRNVLMGERAVGMGGAAVALIDPATYTREDVPAEKIDYYGLTLSLGRLSPNSTIDVALQFVLGTGERVEVLATGAAVHPVSDISFGLTISGSYIFDDEAEEESLGVEGKKEG